MKSYKKYLTETLQSFFEAIDSTLTSLIGYKDSANLGKKVVKVDNENFYPSDEQEEFDNDPDFMDGYSFVSKADKMITIRQKINLTKVSEIVKLSIEETKEEIKNFDSSALFYFNVRIGGTQATTDSGGRVFGFSAGKDFRGYYKFNKILKEDIKTNKGDVYLELELLLDLVRSTSYDDEDEARRNMKGSKGLSVGKGKEAEEDQEPTVEEPTEEDIAKAAKTVEVD